MKHNLKKIIGEVLAVVGFFGIFFTPEESILLQIIWTSSALALFYAGAKLMQKSGAFNEE